MKIPEIKFYSSDRDDMAVGILPYKIPTFVFIKVEKAYAKEEQAELIKIQERQMQDALLSDML